jgi:hypothetical protein
MIELNRRGEDSHPPFRSQRFFLENGQWYFDTREGKQVGPYTEIEDVKKALAVFLAQKLLIIDKSKQPEEILVPGAQDGIEHMVEEIFEFLHQYKLKGQTGANLWANSRLGDLHRDAQNLTNRIERVEALNYALELQD